MEPKELEYIANDALESASEAVVRAVVKQLVISANWELHGTIKNMIIQKARHIVETDPEVQQIIRKSITQWLYGQTTDLEPIPD